MFLAGISNDDRELKQHCTHTERIIIIVFMPTFVIGATVSLEYSVGLHVVSKQAFIANISGHLL
jgi:hypothetical protein